jgi:uncharacterized membrane protein YfcA
MERGKMDITFLAMIASGIVVGVFASFTGLGGGLLMVPILLYLGFSAQKAVGFYYCRLSSFCT